MNYTMDGRAGKYIILFIAQVIVVSTEAAGGPTSYVFHRTKRRRRMQRLHPELRLVLCSVRYNRGATKSTRPPKNPSESIR